MLIDRKHIPWAAFTITASLAATGAYLWDAPRHLSGPRGGTPVGLTLGVIAALIMVFCALLGIKRRVPHWRLGSAQTWMRGHLWLGALTVLLVALHGAFKAGGPLTTWLWILLAIVTVSGVLGVIMQHFMPRLLLHGVPGETVAQQIVSQEALLPKLACDAVDECEAADTMSLRRFHDTHVAPFLSATDNAAHMRIASRTRSANLFGSLRTMIPPEAHDAADKLEKLCDRKRQLYRQKRFMRAMTCWLIFHVPLSWLLLTLTLAHGVVALRYGMR
jgi:hypothetical protein